VIEIIGANQCSCRIEKIDNRAAHVNPTPRGAGLGAVSSKSVSENCHFEPEARNLSFRDVAILKISLFATLRSK
jgi:hypothetical protein